MLFQIIATLLAVITIAVILNRFLKGKTPLSTLLLWLIIWIVVIIFSFSPNITSYLANLFGIGRGLDFVVIAAILLLFYLIFRIYTELDKINSNINKIITNFALDEDDEEK